MAKEIKVIKCPQCGSTDKTEIKPDFYRCTSCQTEYFLDDNDVTINYNHNYNHNNNPFSNPAGANQKAIKVIGIIFGVFIFLIVLSNVLYSLFAPKAVKTDQALYTVSTAEAEEMGYSASRYQPQFFTRTSDGSPIMIVAEDRTYKSRSQEEKEGIYISFYSPEKKSLIAEHRLEGDHSSLTDTKMRTFTDGNLYIIANKTTLYVVDKATLKITDAGKKFFTAKEELQVGVATMEFVYEDSGDGMVLLTNDGKKLYYYPLIQKLYSEENYYDAKKGFNSLLPGAKDKVIHVFTQKSTEYPEDKLQLIKVKYKDNGAGPKDIVDNLSWGKDYGGSGIFTERDPYKKVLFDKYSKNADRILDWKDLTPGRLYFDPEVIYDNGTTLLITFKADANPKSGYKLQKLNPNTGSVEWTTDPPKGAEIKKIISYKNGYIGLSGNDEFIYMDANGKITGTYKID